MPHVQPKSGKIFEQVEYSEGDDGFVVDDDGQGYVDDGRDDYYEDYSDDEETGMANAI